MTTPTFHIAQINVARALAPMNDPLMADFVAQLDEINALAERSEGFVWRLQDEAGNATSIKVYEDNFIIINMSVWESIDALYQYTYYSAHVNVFRQRKAWFEKFGRPHMALWWIPAEELPTALDGRERLEHLQTHGPSPYAFTFKERFPIPPSTPQPLSPLS